MSTRPGVIRVKTPEDVEEVRVHLLPCYVQAEGGRVRADVDGYFETTIRNSEDGRGR